MILALTLIAAAPIQPPDPVTVFRDLCTAGKASLPADLVEPGEGKSLPDGAAAAIRAAVFTGSGILDDNRKTPVDNGFMRIRGAKQKFLVIPPEANVAGLQPLARTCAVAVLGDHLAETRAEALELAKLPPYKTPPAVKSGLAWVFPYERVVVGDHQVATTAQFGWTVLVATPLDAFPSQK
ncbi:MAG: hypothetical protein ACXWI4_02055 [Croceibacterium sp.]